MNRGKLALVLRQMDLSKEQQGLLRTFLLEFADFVKESHVSTSAVVTMLSSFHEADASLDGSQSLPFEGEPSLTLANGSVKSSKGWSEGLSEGLNDGNRDFLESSRFESSAESSGVLEQTLVSQDEVPAFTPPAFTPPVFEKGSSLELPSESPQLRYEYLGLLGEGAVGEVRKVWDPVLKRALAMKVLHQHYKESKAVIRRFMEEAQLGARLQHPNTVPVYELGLLPDGRPYFTMQEIRGQEFATHIRAVHEASKNDSWRPAPNGTTFRRLIQIFHKVCETIAYSHSVGVIHRDLKPQNVMLGDFGEVQVVDWGIAKVLADASQGATAFVSEEIPTNEPLATRTGAVLGTPAYMSPEQAKGLSNQIGKASDIFSLGAILYEILSGRPPFFGSNSMESLFRAQLSKPHPLVPIKNKGSNYKDAFYVDPNQIRIPTPLVAICERAMAKDISDRYSSAEDLAADVFVWLEGAEKRDNALLELQRASTIWEESKALFHRHVELWKKANQELSIAGIRDKEAWSLWEHSRDVKQVGLQKQQEYERTLLGALVFAPELEDTHELLAEYYVSQLQAGGGWLKKKEVETLRYQLQQHVGYLSSAKQEQFAAWLEEDSFDCIDSFEVAHIQQGPLVGRKALLNEIKSEVRKEQRLLSFVGTAGVGKTSLALEVARSLRVDDGQTYFCDLTEARDSLAMARIVGRSVNLNLQSDDPVQQLGEFFALHPCLLVLDNLEQVAQDASQTIQCFLNLAPQLRLITTSRVPLKVPEETVFTVLPMTLLEGIELFAQQAYKANNSFELTSSNRESVGRLVAQLDCLPLAIELAAARLSIFSLHEIQQRLDERFSLLRSRDEKTQALQGALQWSWDLLEPWSKAVLAQASVFHGGFSVESAEAVLRVKHWEKAPALFDILHELCEQGLLRQEKDSTGDFRYGMLESIRAYAEQQLLGEGVVEEDLPGDIAAGHTIQRHADFFAQFGAVGVLRQVEGTNGDALRSQLLIEQDNLIAAAKSKAGESAVLCCFAAIKILLRKGPISFAAKLAEDALEQSDLPAFTWKRLQLQRATLFRLCGDTKQARALVLSLENNQLPSDEAVEGAVTFSPGFQATWVSDKESQCFRPSQEWELLEGERWMEIGRITGVAALYDESREALNNALGVFEDLQYAQGIADAYGELGLIAHYQSNYSAALEMINLALPIAKTLGHPLLLGTLLRRLGNVLVAQGKNAEALEQYQRSAKLSRALGDKKSEVLTAVGMGGLCRTQGEYERAFEYYHAALDLSQELGDKRLRGTIYGNLGTLCLVQGKFEEALTFQFQALQISREIGEKLKEGTTLGNIANMYFMQGKKEEALEHYRLSIDIAREIGDKRSEGIGLGNLGMSYQALERYEEALPYYEKAIEVTSEIGDSRHQGIQLGNLGDLLAILERKEQAKVALRKSIHICDTAVPTAAGAFRASLALLEAEDGLFDQAVSLLESGYPQVSSYAQELVKFMCKQARVYQLKGEPDIATKSFQEAKDCFESLNLNEEHELARRIKETKRMLDEL